MLALGGTAAAQTGEGEPHLEVSAGYGQSDNLGREFAEGDRSAFHWLGVAVDVSADRQRFSGSLSGDVQLRTYSDHESLAFLDDEDEVLGSMDGIAVVDVVPERLDWIFAANTGQNRTSPFEAASPWNREQVNIWSTGPRFDLPIGSRMSVRLEAQRGERSYEESDRLASESDRIDLALSRELSPVASGGLVFSRNEVSYEIGPDYEYESAYLLYARSFSSGGVELKLGANSVSGGNIDRDPTPFTSLRWDRGLGARSRVSLWATRELTEPGELFRTGGVPDLDSPGPGTALDAIDMGDARLQGLVLTQDPMQRTALGMAFTVEHDRTNFSVSLGGSEEKFHDVQAVDDPSFANDSYFAELSIDRELAHRWRGSISVGTVERDFDTEGTSSDFTGRISARRALTNRGAIELLMQRNARTGEIDPSDENIYAISMSYGLAN